MMSATPFAPELQTNTGWKRTLEAFAAWCAPQPGSLVLDIGCGPGLLPALLARAGCRAYGADLDGRMLRTPRLHPDLVQADILRLPFPGGVFHLLTASNLLFLLPDPEAALGEMGRLLRPGGQVCVLNPSEHMSVAAAAELAEQRDLKDLARDSLLNWAALAEKHARWDASALASLFSATGLRLVESTLRTGAGLARFGRGIKNVGLQPKQI